MAKKLHVAIQMDAIHTIKPKSDTTLVLALEAQKRGHTLYYYQPKNMSLHHGKVIASVQPVTFTHQETDFYKLGAPQTIELSDMDVVLMRQDPPFDLNYLTYTYFLERIHPKTLVVNNPMEVRNCPEKLLITHFPEWMPATLITQDTQAIEDFRAKHRDIILKPLYAHGGADIFRIRPDDANFHALLEMFNARYHHPFIVQPYLPEVVHGDKRIILIDGKPVGAINRVPAQGEIRSNLVRGGKAEKTTLTKREMELCKAIGPTLKKRGLILAGIDVIGDYITEINVTSPTGVQAINALDNTCLEKLFWNVVEKKL